MPGKQVLNVQVALVHGQPFESMCSLVVDSERFYRRMHQSKKVLYGNSGITTKVYVPISKIEKIFVHEVLN